MIATGRIMSTVSLREGFCRIAAGQLSTDDEEERMTQLTTALALRAAINVLRDSAESRRMPSGEALDDACARLHAEAAEVLEDALPALREHE